jgi:hypothetical protein
VEAGGATAFIYANFSMPVVKVSGAQTQKMGLMHGTNSLPFKLSAHELIPGRGDKKEVTSR